MEGIFFFLPVRDFNGFSALPEGNQMKSQASAAAEYPKPVSIWKEGRSFACRIDFILPLKGWMLKKSTITAIMWVLGSVCHTTVHYNHNSATLSQHWSALRTASRLVSFCIVPFIIHFLLKKQEPQMAADKCNKSVHSDPAALIITLANMHTNSHRPQEEKQWNEISFSDITQLKPTPAHPAQLQALDLPAQHSSQQCGLLKLCGGVSGYKIGLLSKP